MLHNDMKQQEAKKEFESEDSKIALIQQQMKNKQEQNAPCIDLEQLMPSQLKKYRFICYQIPSSKKGWNNAPNELEALAILPLIYYGSQEKIISVCQNGMELIKKYKIGKQEIQLLNKTQKEFIQNMKIKQNSEQQVKDLLKMIFLQIKELREAKQNFPEGLSVENCQKILKQKLEPIENVLDIKIVAKLSLPTGEDFHYPKTQLSIERPDVFISINKKSGIYQVYYINYQIPIDQSKFNSKHVLFLDNPEKFCANDTTNIIALCFLRNILNQINWRKKNEECTLQDIIDSHFFDAAVESIGFMEKAMSLIYQKVNLKKNVELRWDDLMHFKDQFVIGFKKSIKFTKIKGANVIEGQRTIFYDGFLETQTNGYQMLSFRERISGISKQQPQTYQISIEDRAEFISKLIPELESIIDSNERNQYNQFPQQKYQFSVYRIASGVKNWSNDVVQLSVFSFLLFCSQNKEYDQLEQYLRNIFTSQSSLNETELINRLFKIIQNMKEFSSLKGQLINNPNDIKILSQFILEEMTKKFQDLFNPIISEEVLIESTFKYFQDIGINIAGFTSVQREGKLEYLKQEFLQNKGDILVDTSQTPPRVFIRMQEKSQKEEEKSQDQLDRNNEDDIKKSQKQNKEKKNSDKSYEQGMNQERQQMNMLNEFENRGSDGSKDNTNKKHSQYEQQIKAQSIKLSYTTPQNSFAISENYSQFNSQYISDRQIQSEKIIIEKSQERQQQQQNQIEPTTVNHTDHFSQQDSFQFIDTSTLPQQLSLHNDLFYLVDDWEQVLALFFLFNIKNQIMKIDNTEEDGDQLCQNISSNKLINSSLFMYIFKICKTQGTQQTSQLYWDQGCQYFSQQILNTLPREFKVIRNNSNFYELKEEYSRTYPVQNIQYNADIQIQKNRDYKYTVELIPQQRANKNTTKNVNPQYTINLCKVCNLRVITVNMQQMCSYCFAKQIQDSY